MAWGRTVEIGEETFAGPSDEQFAKFTGHYYRLLDLNTVGSWATLWIAGLVSAKITRQDMYGVTTNLTVPGTPHLSFGMYSSAGTRPTEPISEFGGHEGLQWMGGNSSLSGTWSCYKSGTKYYMNYPWWSRYVRGDGTGATISGGQQQYLCFDTGPSIRAVFHMLILKDSPVWKFSSGIGMTSPFTTDNTKQDIIDWLLGYDTTINWQINRPTGALYLAGGASAVDMLPGTYGSFDSFFMNWNIPGVELKVHGLWGRTFSTVV